MKLYDFADWQFVAANEPVKLDIGNGRMVRLEVAVAKPCTVVMETNDGALMSVYCAVRETYEFYAKGYISITAGADLQVYTPEMEDIRSVSDDVSFTRIIERRERNPEVEAIYHMMYENTRRMMEQQAQDRAASEARYAELLRSVTRDGGDDSGTGDTGHDAPASGEHGVADAVG